MPYPGQLGSVNVCQSTIRGALHRAPRSTITADPSRPSTYTISVEVTLTGFLSGQFDNLRGLTLCLNCIDAVQQVLIRVHQIQALTPLKHFRGK